MMTKKYPLMVAAAMTLLTACYHEKHEYEANEYGGQPVGYVTPQLILEDDADTTAIAAMDNISFQLQSTDGMSRASSFPSIAKSADWLQQLPAGEYDILVTTDMDEPSGYVLTSSGSAAGNLLTPTTVSLRDPASSPRQSWFAVTHATVLNDQITVAEFKLQRLLPTLELTIGGMPEGYSINAQVEHVAQHVLLTAQNEAGRYGVPSAEEQTVDFGALPAEGTTFSMTKRLMPTASSQERTIIHLYLVTPEGIDQDCTIDAPKMLMGQYYKLALTLDDIHPYIYIKSTDVNGWTVGSTLDGGQATE